MRNGFALLVAGALFLSPTLGQSLLGQQGGAQPPTSQQGGRQGAQGGGAAQPAAQQTAPPSVQVGVPEGRQGGGQGGRQGGGGRGRAAGPPPAPAPRRPDGRVYLMGPNAKVKGLWLPNFSITAPAADINTIAWMPWSKALYDDRQKHELEPHTRCKASGVTRQFLTPYGVEFVELEDQKRIFIFDVGGPHTFRTIYMDGREHPKDLVPSYYGHNVGHWEGDTLVVDAVGFVESFWLDRRGLPHTDKLHTTERFTRTDAATIKYEVTIDDPGAYLKPYTGGFNLRWENDTELFEYVCQQANYAGTLMVGEAKSVDRSTTFIP